MDETPPPSSVAETIVQKLAFKQSVFLTGGAGVGKTYTTLEVIRQLVTRGYKLLQCAPTGVAALNLPNGRTLHSTFKLPVGTWPTFKQWAFKIKAMLDRSGRARAPKEPWIEEARQADVLIIDEVSMCSAWLIEILNVSLRMVRQPNKPLGGIPVLLIGDFLQLSPVYDTKGKVKPSPRQKLYAFESPVWTALKPFVVQLSEVKRQTDSVFTSMLNNIRNGRPLSTGHKQLLSSRKGIPPYDAVRIMVRRADVIRINEHFMQETLKKGTRPVHFQFPFRPSTGPKDLVEAIEQDVRHNLYMSRDSQHQTFCVGARVMQIVNTGGYVNGDRGTVVGFVEIPESLRATSGVTHFSLTSTYLAKDGSEFSLQCKPSEEVDFNRHGWWAPLVKFDRTNETLAVGPYEWERRLYFGDSHCARVRAIPLCLAWASTVHKVQGATLSGNVHIDCHFMDWVPASFYVSLSRATDIANVTLSNYQDKFKCQYDATQFYQDECKVSGACNLIACFDEESTDEVLEDEMTSAVQNALSDSLVTVIPAAAIPAAKTDDVQKDFDERARPTLDSLAVKYSGKRREDLLDVVDQWKKSKQS